MYKRQVLDAVKDAKRTMSTLFPKAKHLHRLIELVDRAIALSADPKIRDLDAIKKLGEGWVAEETLAIDVYKRQSHIRYHRRKV